MVFLQDSIRLLVLWVLACCLLKTAREIIRIMHVHHESWWQSAAVLFAFVFSWTYVTTIFLSSCILFHVVCNLQIIHFEDYGKLLERESDVVVLLQEHARLRYYLSKISHRFRIYLLLQFVIVTISLFMTLFQTTGYNGVITFINGGDFAVSSKLVLPIYLFHHLCVNQSRCIYIPHWFHVPKGNELLKMYFYTSGAFEQLLTYVYIDPLRSLGPALT